MYIMGHQQRDVSEWAKCRKLITHHLFKEMKMIDIRSKLKVHKVCMRESEGVSECVCVFFFLAPRFSCAEHGVPCVLLVLMRSSNFPRSASWVWMPARLLLKWAPCL
jgi:hypothetical protein